jgi:catechol 2,3-dioxygenase-like lactoylglutathione lyase family enzyme
VLADSSLPVIDVDHIGIAVPDLDQALDLFVGRLGWLETMRGVATDGITAVAFVALGAAELELFEAPGSEVAVLDHIALRTDDITVAAQILEAHGVPMDGEEIEAVRGRAQRIDSSATFGLFFHLSQR